MRQSYALNNMRSPVINYINLDLVILSLASACQYLVKFCFE